MATTLEQGNTASEGFGSILKNSRQIVIVLVVLLAAVAGFSILMSSRGAKADAGRNALFLAEKALETEMKALLPATPAPTAADPKKAKTPPAPEADPSFLKLDVDAKFPEALKKFRAVAADFSGTRSAFDAEMAVGGLYYNHGSPEKALGSYERAATVAPSTFEKSLALSSIGYSHENAGQLKEAQDAYDKALNLGEAGLKGDLLMAKARVLELQKDANQAKATYDQVISQLPNSNYAKYAEIFKSRLE